MKKHIFLNLTLIFLSPWIVEFFLINYLNTDSFIENQNTTVQKNYLLKKDEKITLEKLKHEGYEPTIYPSILSKNNFYKNLFLDYNFIPLGAQPNTKTYLCDEGYGFIKFNTDHLGFRNNIEDWKKSKVALIGDSYVHGSCVEDNFTISGHLKDMGIYNLNFGIGNHQSAHYYYTIDQFIKKNRFENVVLLFSLHNDLMGIDEGDNLFLKNFNSYTHNLESSEIQLSKGGTKFYETLKKNLKNLIKEENQSVEKKSLKNFFKLDNLRNTLRANYGIWINKDLICVKKKCLYGSLDKRFEKELIIVKKTILKLIERCNPEKNCNPMIILLHHPKFYDHDIIYDFRRSYFNEFVNKIKDDSSYLEYVDAASLIDPNLKRNYAPAGSHFSISGYKEVAKIIYNNIK